MKVTPCKGFPVRASRLSMTPGTTVTAREVKALEGYVLDGQPKSILIKSGEVQTLRFYNEPGMVAVSVTTSVPTTPLMVILPSLSVKYKPLLLICPFSPQAVR